MQRTPIKVRGRRGNRSNGELKILESTQGSRLAKPSSSSSLRTMTKGSKWMNRKAPYPSSIFDKLPNELLHRVFLHALNLSLPAVSLHLARALSGPGAHYLKLEYSLRTLYKPLSQLHIKWLTHGDLIAANSRMARLLTSISADAVEELMASRPETVVIASSQQGPEFSPTYEDAKHFLLQKLRLKRWKQYRQVQSQERLVNARFFDWSFLQHLIRKAHPIFQKEIAGAHACLELSQEALSNRERWWMSTSADELVSGMQRFPPAHDGVPDFKEHLGLPWLRFKRGVHLPSKCTHGPWAYGEDILLYWLVQGNCGASRIARAWPMEFPPVETVMSLPSSMLMDAVKMNKEWIVFICAIRARTQPTTEMLQQALAIDPFPFVVVQNLLYAASKKDEAEASAPSHPIDPLDQHVWSFIEQQEAREDARAELLDGKTRIEDCISVAKWLRCKLRKMDDSDGPIDALPYFPLRPPRENLMVEWTVNGRGWKTLSDVPHDAELREILIAPSSGIEPDS